MKKLYFSLLALTLSTATFAANPGTDKSATINVEAKLTIINAASKVVVEELTDAGTWKVISSTVTFDHGIVTKGSTEVPTPSILKNFRVRKLDSNSADSLTTQTTIRMGGNSNGTFAGILKSGDTVANTDPDIPHVFRYTPNPIAGLDKVANFNIESEIGTLSGKESVGAYNRVETITITVL